MPKETFLNLPQEKREAIIQVALEEFAQNDFEKASLSRMVQRLGIAKGSMYQYFENKEDLYQYLIDQATQAKVRYLQATGADLSHLDFYQLFHALFFAGMRFNLSHPLHSQVAARMMTDTSNPERWEPVQKAAEGYFLHLVQEAQAKGEVNPEFPPQLVAKILFRISLEIGTYLLESWGLTLQEVVMEKGMERIEPEQVEAFAGQVVAILQKGLDPR